MAKKVKPKITGEKLAKMLFKIHTHIGVADRTDDLIYYEKNLIPLLVKLGLPKPIWQEDIKRKKQKLTRKHKKQ